MYSICTYAEHASRLEDAEHVHGCEDPEHVHGCEDLEHILVASKSRNIMLAVVSGADRHDSQLRGGVTNCGARHLPGVRTSEHVPGVRTEEHVPCLRNNMIQSDKVRQHPRITG